MSYTVVQERLEAGKIVILDGGTGTELQRRGARMDPGAWCGPASAENSDILEQVHRDYIAAGADIVTANTYASSRLMLGPAGYGERFAEINGAAIDAAHRAREASGCSEVLVAGSLSHMAPFVANSAQPDLAQAPSRAAMAEAFTEMATFLRDGGCDLILLEMMYYPERMHAAFEAALATGLPVWAGFSARRGAEGQLLSFAPDREIPFGDLVGILADYDLAAAGVMHTPSHLVTEALEILRDSYTGPLLAYPDSGYFRMPEWQFDEIIPPDEFFRYASQWIADGAQIVGGCCGLSPEHIDALRPLRSFCTEHRA
ncbi:MAG: homocysteine S-methyltransferase family protein [Spirochaetaceae bacterium]|nr:MAG: homocysteine S-methyltransferase family protein [Spirochaetaceae bacterium]